MNYKQLIIKIKKDESTIKNLVKNIKKEVERAESFDDGYVAKIEIMQKEYSEACRRMNAIEKIYETNYTDAESN